MICLPFYPGGDACGCRGGPQAVFREREGRVSSRDGVTGSRRYARGDKGVRGDFSHEKSRSENFL